MALRSAAAMGHQYVCKACGRRLTVPDELFASKIRGRLVTVKCKGCGEPIGIDGTVPPPPIETGEGTPSGASELVPGDSSGPRLGHASSTKEKRNEGGPVSSSKPFPLARRSSRPPPPDTNTGDAPQPNVTARKVDVAGLKSRNQPLGSLSGSSQPPRPTTSHKGKLAPLGEGTKAMKLKVPASKSAEEAPQLASRNALPPPSNVDEGPEISTGTLEEAEWESSSGGSQRFSHVDGPLPVKHPTARIGRYALFEQFAEGGIATVHFGRIDGAGGFSRVVAIKRLLPHLVANEEFTEMLLKEARFAARVRHPNVVPTLDVVASEGDVLLVLEYIHGESLSGLCRKQAKTLKDHMPVEIAVAIMLDVLSGLSAVHEATDEKGRALGLVHRDISPPNVVVGADGYARVLDFGIAKALEHIEESIPTRLKGKIGYMAPEQIRGEGVSQRSDVFAAGVILWEVLATRRMFSSSTEADRMKEIVAGNYPTISRFRPTIPKDLEDVTMKALSVDPAQRFADAREFADALEHASPRASARRVSEWVSDVAADILLERARMIAQVENWNAGKEIPLRSSAFAAEAVQAFESVRPPPNTAAGAEAPFAKTREGAPASERAVTTNSKSKFTLGSSWLLIASCIILLLALYYAVWK
jgi:eukaryotic-like serine/threonine-protein kinase